MKKEFHQKLAEKYTHFKESTINERRFTIEDIKPLIEKRKDNAVFKVETIGHSFENREIFRIKFGTGSKVLLLWSQMHGDESTATMALLDIFNFLEGNNDSFDDFRTKLAQEYTIYFVPMLNPDGAQRFKRRNALEIDLNRDALSLASPEARLLKEQVMLLKPEFGYNLHDQSPRYTAGSTSNLATISFLATAYNFEREINPTRLKSMQLIVGMNNVLQEYIPKQVGRFSDEFEPRAFGDNIQKWGTSLVLIESGGYKNDPEKQYIRYLNYLAILGSFNEILKGNYTNNTVGQYESIPQNEKGIFDVLIKNVTKIYKGQKVTMDIGFNIYERPVENTKSFSKHSIVEDLGDLCTFFGTETIDATGMILVEKQEFGFEGKANFQLIDKNGVLKYNFVDGKQQ